MGAGPDNRNGSAASLGVRLCNIMAGARSLHTHVQYQCTLFQCLSWLSRRFTKTPSHTQTSRARYTVLNSPARNEELPYRAPKATQVDRSSVRSDTSRELSALRAHAHRNIHALHCTCAWCIYNPRPFLFRLCHRQKSMARDTNVTAHAQS